MLVRKRPWEFVSFCFVCVCCEDNLFDFAMAVASVDDSAADLV